MFLSMLSRQTRWLRGGELVTHKPVILTNWIAAIGWQRCVQRGDAKHYRPASVCIPCFYLPTFAHHIRSMDTATCEIEHSHLARIL